MLQRAKSFMSSKKNNYELNEISHLKRHLNNSEIMNENLKKSDEPVDAIQQLMNHLQMEERRRDGTRKNLKKRSFSFKTTKNNTKELNG